jgi:hypothetical protein
MEWFNELLKGVRFSFCGVLGGKNEFNGEHRINVDGLGVKLNFIVSASVFGAYPGDGLPVRVTGKLGRKSNTTFASLSVDDVIYNNDQRFKNVSQDEITRGCVFSGFGLLTERREFTREGVVYDSILVSVLGDIIKFSNFSEGVFSSIPDVARNDRLFVNLSGVCSSSLSYSTRYQSHGGICVPFLEKITVLGSLPIGTNSKFVPIGEPTVSPAQSEQSVPAKKAG